MRPPFHHLARRCDLVAPATVLADTATFAVLIGVAMRAYPGGTAWDPATEGHDFWLNYLCDLERQTALDGRANELGSALARTAVLVLGLGSVAFWNVLPALFTGRVGLGRAVRRLGIVSAGGLVAVALLPGDRFPEIHPLILLIAGGAAIAGAACGVVGLSSRRAWPALAVVGATAVVVGSVDLSLYVRQQFVATPAPAMIAVLERVALLLSLVWRALVAWSAMGLGRAAAPAAS